MGPLMTVEALKMYGKLQRPVFKTIFMFVITIKGMIFKSRVYIDVFCRL